LAASPRPPIDLDVDQYRTSSPLPAAGRRNQSPNDETGGAIKFSFRVGGGDEFYKRLKNAMVQRKWLLQGAPPVPKPTDDASGSDAPKAVGIAGLEMRGQEQRRNNEQIIGGAFEDLEALMTSAKEIIALAESFSAQAREGNLDPETNALLSQSALALGMTTTTKDMLASDAVYISELSKSLAEFLTDDSKAILRREGGIMSLVDVWALFNRARNGVELVSPADFTRAAQQWDRLRLPIHLRRFKSGLLVVQGRDRTDERVIAAILAWLAELRAEPPGPEAAWDWRRFGRGVTVQETAARFGWSIGVATEELEMAEESRALCRENGLGGVLFWENWIDKL
jgi:ESCRT-II complex subunit VPS36